MGGVLPWGAWVSEGTEASGWAACCSWGVPWARGPRVEVGKWWFGTAMSMDADLTEGDMDLARIEGADTDPPPECSGIVEVRCASGTFDEVRVLR